MSELVSVIGSGDVEKVEISRAEWVRRKKQEKVWRRFQRAAWWLTGGVALATVLGWAVAWYLNLSLSPISSHADPGPGLGFMVAIVMGIAFCFGLMSLVTGEIEVLALPLLSAIVFLPIMIYSVLLSPPEKVLPTVIRDMAVLAEHHRLPPAQVTTFRKAVQNLAATPKQVSASRFYLLNKLAFGKAYYPRAIRYQKHRIQRTEVLSAIATSGTGAVGVLLLADLLLWGGRSRLSRNLRESAKSLYPAEDLSNDPVSG